MINAPSSIRVAVILPAESEYSARLLEGAMQYVEKHPEITLLEMGYSVGSSPLPEHGEFGFDAALVWPYPVDHWMERLLEDDIFVISAGANWRNPNVPLIAFSGSEVENRALDYFSALGRSQVAYIGIDTSQGFLAARRSRFLNAVEELGLGAVAYEIKKASGIKSIHRLMNMEEEEALALQHFLAELPKPAAVWCDDDYVARLVCDHAMLVGIKVPEELAVLGVGDYSISRLGNPHISTIPQPGQHIGSYALEMIQKVLNGGKLDQMVIGAPSPQVLERESTTGSRLDDAYRRAFREIRDRACHGITVSDLVSMLSVSQVTFTKRFTKMFGCSPGVQIKRVKVERAKHYLKYSDHSIEKIAESCGFEDQGNFSKFFKRHTEKTATEYRRSEAEEPSSSS